MPLGVVSDTDWEKELTHCGVSHQSIIHGRNNKKEVPSLIRELVAEEAISGEKASVIAEKYGVSESSVSAYKHDATSTASYDQPDTGLTKANNLVRDQIITTARAKLIAALEHITPEKLADAKLRDVASVAKDMSAVMSNAGGNIANINAGNAQFIFHVPKARRENEYEVIDVVS
jgi:hypothetical protein